MSKFSRLKCLRDIAIAACLAAIGTSASASVLLKLNESLGPGSVEDIALQTFKHDVETGTNGQVKIAIYLQDALGKPDASLEGLMSGTLDLYSGALEYYGQVVPMELNATAIPYLFKDWNALHRYLHSPIFAAAQQKLLAHGIRFISTDYNAVRGPYRVLVSSKPVKSLDDIRGLKLRVFPNDVYIRAWKYLGAIPVQLSWTETYLGIRQGVVQAVTAPMAIVYPSKLAEVAPYIAVTNEYPQTWPIAISEMTWKKLTPDQQKVLVSAVFDAGKAYTEKTNEQIQSDIAAMTKQNHVTITTLNGDDFRKKMAPFYAQLIKEGLLTQDLYNEIQAINKQ